MSEEKIDDDVVYVIDTLVDQVDEETAYDYYPYICDDCSMVNSSVKRQIRSERETTNEIGIDLYLCENCAQTRHADAQKVLKDLEYLAQEVEQRLQAIENTERELDQWRDAQLQKNRDFWDEYRRQVENFSACRIRTLQYEYTMRQLKSERIIKRLKRAKYISEHIEQLRDELFHFLQPSLIDLLCSEKLKNQFSAFLTPNDNQENNQNSTTVDDRRELIEQLEQLACLDTLMLPGDELVFDEQVREEIDD